MTPTVKDVANSIIESVRVDGAKIETSVCKRWRENHDNCKGCPSEEKCKEFALRAIQLVEHLLEQLEKEAQRDG